MERSLWAVLVGTFTLRFSTGLTGAMLAFYLADLPSHGGPTVSSTTIGIFTATFFAAELIMSPVFGLLADRWGRVRTILLGCGILGGCVGVIALDQDDSAAVTVALVLLGLGWSAVTVAGSALLTEASAENLRTRRQGRNDFLMSLVAAVGATGAGGLLSWVGFAGLALFALPVIVAIVALTPLARASVSPTSFEGG